LTGVALKRFSKQASGWQFLKNRRHLLTRKRASVGGWKKLATNQITP
jgi:ribosomal protein L35